MYGAIVPGVTRITAKTFFSSVKRVAPLEKQERRTAHLVYVICKNPKIGAGLTDTDGDEERVTCNAIDKNKGPGELFSRPFVFMIHEEKIFDLSEILPELLLVKPEHPVILVFSPTRCDGTGNFLLSSESRYSQRGIFLTDHSDGNSAR